MADLPTLTVQQLQDQLAHINDDRSQGMLAAAITFIVITIAVTGLRLSSRRIQGLRLGADDYMVVVSLVRRLSAPSWIPCRRSWLIIHVLGIGHWHVRGIGLW